MPEIEDIDNKGYTHITNIDGEIILKISLDGKSIECECQYTLCESKDEKEKPFIAFAPAFQLLCNGDTEIEAIAQLKKGIENILKENSIPYYLIEGILDNLSKKNSV